MDLEISKNRKLAKAVVHVDLDGAPHIFQSHGWDYNHNDDPIFESGFKNMISFLQRNKVKATLFAIASDLDDSRKFDLLKNACHHGHEIASHGLTHAGLTKLNLERKRIEIAQSKEKIEKGLITDVKGFRAPNFDIDRECLELLDEYGYEYDSSTFPTAKFSKRLQVSKLVEYVHRPYPSKNILELPLPKYKPAPFPFHPSYSLVFGITFFKWGLARFRKTGLPLVLLFHLTDLSEPLSVERAGNMMSKIYTLSHISAEAKMRRCQAMINLVQQHFEIVSTRNLLSQQINGN